jgi:lysophospholipase L1-like esterase
MQINSNKYFFFIFTVLVSAAFFLSIEPGRSVKTWGSGLWFATIFFQIIIWGYFFFKNSNVFLSIFLFNLYIIIVVNFISTPFTSSIQSYFSLPKNMNIKRILSDDTMYGFDKNKKIIIKTDVKGFRVSNKIDYLANETQKKIILLGGSQVEEIYLNFDETWGNELSKNLIKDYNEKIEVVNTGVSGLRVDQLKKNLLYFVNNEINGEHYFFLFGNNDWNQHIIENNFSNLESLSHKFSFRKSFIMKLYTLINLELNPASRNKTNIIERYGKNQSNSLENRRIIGNNLTSIPIQYKNDVKQLIKICSDKALSCIFLESPNAYNKKVSNKLKKNFWQTPPNANYSINLEGLVNISILYNNWLKEIVEKNNFLFCEINKFLEPTEKNFYDDSHLNPQGSKKFSEIVYKCINSKN